MTDLQTESAVNSSPAVADENRTENRAEESRSDAATAQTPISKSQRIANNQEVIAYLAEKFPLCFILDGDMKPLKIGLFQDLADALKDDETYSKTQLRHALRQYSSNWRYLEICVEGAVRVDLNGEPAGVLEAEHAQYAATQLAESKARVAERRKAAAKKKAANRKPNAAKASGKKPGQPKPTFRPLDLTSLNQGGKVKVKVGNRTQQATVLDVLKDGVRVELDNGLVMTVTAERLVA